MKQPYRSVGRLINANAPTSWGTGTLIGPRHVLTAAHVVEHLLASQSALGPATFVLPDGRRSEIIANECDGGWRKKLVSHDFALLALRDELGRSGAYANWAEFDDNAHLGATLHITGYDADLWLEAGRPATPVPYDRTVPVFQLNKYFVDAFIDPSILVPGVVGGALAHQAKLARPFLGLAGLGLGYFALQGHLDDRLGWSAGAGVQAGGASGGPLWIDDPAGPRVVGVTGHAAPLGERAGVSYGRPVGSKLTTAMVRDFIRAHP
jgi:hypothetical protein